MGAESESGRRSDQDDGRLQAAAGYLTLAAAWRATLAPRSRASPSDGSRAVSAPVDGHPASSLRSLAGDCAGPLAGTGPWRSAHVASSRSPGGSPQIQPVRRAPLLYGGGVRASGHRGPRPAVSFVSL